MLKTRVAIYNNCMQDHLLRGRDDRPLHGLVALRLCLPVQEAPEGGREAFPGSQTI